MDISPTRSSQAKAAAYSASERAKSQMAADLFDAQLKSFRKIAR